MLLVIAGAGASYDALTEHDVPPMLWNNFTRTARPPLAKELFEPRSEFGKRMPPKLRGLASSLRGSLTVGAVLEEQLEQLTIADDATSLSELMALRFYLERIIRWCEEESLKLGLAGNNYNALIRKLVGWSRETGEAVSYATFNYDRFLERALDESADQSIDNLASYVSDSKCRLYKLHGSVGWVHPGITSKRPTGDLMDYIIRNAAIIRPGAIALQGEQTDSPADASLEYPAIAVPTVNKDSFECPDEHLEALRHDLASVDRILVVGWRGAENGFLQLLSGHLPDQPIQVLVANDSSKACKECFDRLSEAVTNSGSRHLKQVFGAGGEDLSFSRLVATDSVESLLSSST